MCELMFFQLKAFSVDRVGRRGGEKRSEGKRFAVIDLKTIAESQPQGAETLPLIQALMLLPRPSQRTSRPGSGRSPSR